MSNPKSTADSPAARFCDLPFNRSTDDKQRQAAGWTLPATGGYTGGCNAGQAAARAYLKYKAAEGGYGGGTLQLVALAFFDRLESAANEDERAALRGQAVGFFSALDYTLRDAVRLLYRPETWDDAEIERAIDAGVRLDEAAYWREHVRKWRSAAAKRGWATRRKAARRVSKAA